MTALRKIAPMEFPDLAKIGDLGRKPKLVWVEPTQLLVDGTYQRDLSRQSVRLIREIIKSFAWNQLKPPIAVEVASGYHVIDGQHTAIAAASIGVTALPIFVVEAETVIERANAFVGHNKRRLNISRLQIHRAMVAAGDEDAMDVANVCRRAGLNLRHKNGVNSKLNIGDCAAVSTIESLVQRRGVIRARQTLELLVKAKLAPVSEAHILAADYLVGDSDVPWDDLCAAIRIEGEGVIARAIPIAKTERRYIWQVVAEIWLKRMGRVKK